MNDDANEITAFPSHTPVWFWSGPGPTPGLLIHGPADRFSRSWGGGRRWGRHSQPIVTPTPWYTVASFCCCVCVKTPRTKGCWAMTPSRRDVAGATRPRLWHSEFYFRLLVPPAWLPVWECQKCPSFLSLFFFFNSLSNKNKSEDDTGGTAQTAQPFLVLTLWSSGLILHLWCRLSSAERGSGWSRRRRNWGRSWRRSWSWAARTWRATPGTTDASPGRFVSVYWGKKNLNVFLSWDFSKRGENWESSFLFRERSFVFWGYLLKL